MNTEYQWWLLAVLAAAGVGILWLLRGSLPRRELDVEPPELAGEARWISRRLRDEGDALPAETVQRVLELHRGYLDEPPPGAPLETELMPLPPPAPADRPATRTARDSRGRRPDRSRRATPPASTSGERELPPARYRESRSGG